MPMFTRETLDAFAREALPEADMATVEKGTRAGPVAAALLREVLAAADPGDHTVGGVWRRERLSCPSREQLGNYLLNAGDADLWRYVDFHLTTVGCTFCRANLDDLRARRDADARAADDRRRQIFASSAGLLPAGGK